MKQFETVRVEEFAQRVKLQGITLTPRIVNKIITGVELTDLAGNTVLFEKRGYSDFETLVPVKPRVKKWKVNGTYKTLGLVERTFSSEQEALDAYNEIKALGFDNADWNSVEVEVDSE